MERPADWEARGLTPGRRRGALPAGAAAGATSGRCGSPWAGRTTWRTRSGWPRRRRGSGSRSQEIAAGLEAFRGVKRRQEVRGVAGGVTVIDDFAHHPTAVDRTLAAIQGSYPGARLLVAFEPRSNTSRAATCTRRSTRGSFGARGRGVAAAARPPTDRVPEAERLDVDRLAAEITARGVPAAARGTVDEIVADVAARARPGDVVVAMSNGAFGGDLDEGARGAPGAVTGAGSLRVPAPVGAPRRGGAGPRGAYSGGGGGRVAAAEAARDEATRAPGGRAVPRGAVSVRERRRERSQSAFTDGAARRQSRVATRSSPRSTLFASPSARAVSAGAGVPHSAASAAGLRSPASPSPRGQRSGEGRPGARRQTPSPERRRSANQSV